jgi:hypothetical protein
MVLPTVMFYFGAIFLTLDILRACGYKAPFRISSTPKGAAMPTALYVLIEDVVAVDGAGGQMYRYALRTRYLSSPYFRRMLVQMNYFWAGGSLIWAAAITAMVFTTPQDAAFVVSQTTLFKLGIVRLTRIFPNIDRMVCTLRLGRSLDFNYYPLGPE